MSSSKALAKYWSYKRYKQYEVELRNNAHEWFKHKKFAVDSKYPFILEKYDDWPNNIIEPKVSEYIQNEMKTQKSFPLHKYIHHGLSSQALIFNLIGLMLVDKDITPLISLLKKKGLTLHNQKYSAEFEYDDRDVFNEDSGQPTSLDLVIKDENNIPIIFLESKLVEKEFGGCSVYQQGDCDGKNPINNLEGCFLNHIGRKYWKLLTNYGFDKTAIGTDSACVLINNYQYFRELLFALEKGGVFVLLFDERNPTFFNPHKDGKDIRGLMNYLKQLTPQEHHNKVAHISIQELVNEISSYNKYPWIEEFKLKYGLKKLNP